MKKWTKETLQIEALKYSRRIDFEQTSNWAYKVARKIHVLDEICSHMKRAWEEKWVTFNIIFEEALKYKTRKEFSIKNASAYNAARRMKILDAVCKHMKAKAVPLSDKLIEAEAKKYNSRFEFQKKSRRAYMIALRNSTLDSICSHMETINNNWTKDSILKEMKKYSSRKDFMKKSKNAYNAALRLGMLKEINLILGREREPCTIQRIFIEARKYNHRNKFLKNNPYAHRMAVKFDILDKVCIHMKRVGSLMEQELMDEIRKILPSVKKYSDHRVKIVGKEYIKYLEIDIFFPPHRRGIEFDGTWHHSLEGLKRSRPTWPEKDISFYHEIKDNYFKSQGIDILHITEEEWLKNKVLCVQKALNFLTECS